MKKGEIRADIASKLRIQTKDSYIIKGSSNMKMFHTINPILIDNQTIVSLADKDEKMTEGSGALSENPQMILNYCNLIDFFIVSNGKLEYEEWVEQEVTRDEEYNFDFVIPDVVGMKTIIEEYLSGLKIKSLEERLGEAVLKVPKRWYKGGYLWLWYKANQIKKKYAKEIKGRG